MNVRRVVLAAVMGMVCLGALADWSYGTANFRGDRPSNSRSIGSVTVFYNGSLTLKGTFYGEDCYEGTGDICVIYPKNYKGRKLNFTSSGGSVQIRHLQ